MKLSFIVPCWNEEEGIPSLIAALRETMRLVGPGYQWEFLFIDDGSTDQTAARLAAAQLGEARVRIIRHPCNRGLGAALRTGFAQVTGELVVTNDSDCTFDPRELPQMLALLEPDVDVIVASPYHPQGSVLNVPAYRLFLSRNLSRLYNAVLRTGLHSYTSLFRLYRAEVIRDACCESNGFLAVTQILVGALRQGYRVREYPMQLSTRRYGRSKAVILRMVRDHLTFLARLLTGRVRVPAAGIAPVSSGAPPSPTIVISPLSPEMRRERRAVAKLHAQELGSSDLVALGEEFLEQVYYGRLLKDPDYCCLVGVVEGSVAGFIAFSADARTSCRRLVLRSWPGIIWALMKSLARRPSRIVPLARLAAGWLTMAGEPCAEVKAEAMTTAVAAPYRTREFFQRTGINVAQALYLAMAQSLSRQGVKFVKGFTVGSNVRVAASLSFLGWRKVQEGPRLRPTVREHTWVWVWELDRALAKFTRSVASAPGIPEPSETMTAGDQR